MVREAVRVLEKVMGSFKGSRCPWGHTVDFKGSRSANGSLMHP